MRKRTILQREDGSLMVIGMMVLMILTVIGIAATSVSTVETEIAANDMVYKDELYRAEAAALELAQQLEDAVEAVLADRDFPNPWLRPRDESVMEDIHTWISGLNCAVTDLNAQQGISNPDDPTISHATIRYTAMEMGVAPLSSLDMTQESNLVYYQLYGLCEDGNRNSLIRLGYLLRY